MNYQKCLVKPFFEAGVKDMALSCGYSSTSIGKCSLFKRTHHFLLEVWESLYRVMITQFLKYRAGNYQKCDKDIYKTLEDAYPKLTDKQYDERATSAVVWSVQEELEGLEDDFRLFLQLVTETKPGSFGWDLFSMIVTHASCSTCQLEVLIGMLGWLQ